MMANLPPPFLNRLVDAMFPHSDPKADQNIWNLARAAEEVFRADQADEFFRTGDPAKLSRTPIPISGLGTPLTPEQQKIVSQLTFASPQAPAPLDHLAMDPLAEIKAITSLIVTKAPDVPGNRAARMVDHLIQSRQSAEQRRDSAEKILRHLARILSPKQPIAPSQLEDLAEALMKELTELREGSTAATKTAEKLAVAEDVISQIRGALDPDGQFEDESLIVLARERMNQRAARGDELRLLQRRIGTEIERNSAEMLRRVLGAQENETLGQAAKRVREERDGARSRLDREIGEHGDFEAKIRELVGAQPDVDDWDNSQNQQPTLDAVRRVIRRLADAVPYDATADSWSEFMSRIQEEWDGTNELPPLPWEREA